MPRSTDWIDTVLVLDPNSGSSSNISLITGLAPVNLRGATLIRTIIRLDFCSSSIAGAYGVQLVQLGIGIASQEAFAAGVLPDPRISTDSPARGWIWRSAIAPAQNSVGSPVMYRLDADIRGARKIENGEVFIIADNDPLVGTAFNVLVRGLVRLLIKLP